jgi:hypothetical protein
VDSYVEAGGIELALVELPKPECLIKSELKRNELTRTRSLIGARAKVRTVLKPLAPKLLEVLDQELRLRPHGQWRVTCGDLRWKEE